MRRKRKKIVKTFTLFDKITLGINILCAVLILLSYLAPSTNPRDYSSIAILGFVYPILLVINFLFIIYWAVRKKKLFLISTLSALTGISTMLGFFQFSNGSKPPQNKSNGSLRLMTYNVREFKGIDKFAEMEISHEVFKIIKYNQPDILNLEEYALKRAENGAIPDSIKTILKSNYYYFKPFKLNREDLIGNAIFSKYPIVDTGSIPAPAMLYTRTIFADIKYNNDTIRVYCVHLAAVTIQNKEKNKYLRGSVPVSSSSFISNKLTSAFVARSMQVARIKAHIEKCRYPYILAGDFNDTPNSYSVNELGDGLINAFKEKGGGFQTTYYSNYPLHIDHVFVSPQFDILNYQAIDKKIADHKPIISDLKLNAN